MEQVILPYTSMRVSRLGFGTASIHHLFREKDRLNLLFAAYDAGITHFDTARMYGEGMAESTLGKFMSHCGRSRITIGTKLGFPAKPFAEHLPALMYLEKASSSVLRRFGIEKQRERMRDLSPRGAEKSLMKSLRALRTDYVDVLFIHEPSIHELAKIRDLVPWLEQQKQKGHVRYLGLSGKADVCLAISSMLPECFDILQVEDSLVGMDADALRKAGRALQITFGYFRRWSEERTYERMDEIYIVRKALERNEKGMILFSTRRIERIKKAAAAVEQVCCEI
ncbi:aldo/keto reductase [Candidatus Parcubacteria bacterium]|nr:MAG: aldo/keto reductase [Candidatus Parcubacteria bacterium]